MKGFENNSADFTLEEHHNKFNECKIEISGTGIYLTHTDKIEFFKGSATDEDKFIWIIDELGNVIKTTDSSKFLS